VLSNRTKVVVWGPGRLGGFVLRVLLQRPEEFDVVGVFAFSADKEGRDVGELAGLAPTGVRVTRDRDEIDRLDADVVIFTPLVALGPTESHADALRLLASGKNLLLAHDYFYPAGISADYASELDSACQRGGSSVMAVGSSPGFVAERLATTLAGHTLEVAHVDVLERMDCTDLDAHVYPLLGFGAKPEDFPREQIIAMFDRMYRQTPYAVAAQLGQQLDEVVVDARFATTDRELTNVTADVPPGTVAGTEFSWTGLIDEEPFVRITCRWVCDLQIPDWDVDNDWIITVEGTPSLQIRYARGSSFADGVRHGGHVSDPDGEDWMDSQSWTSVAAFVNAIPGIVAAPPGHVLAPVFGAPQHRRVGTGLQLR
jgi:2,4-diaminopentanoate dehydrogenase